jgi:shikimate kinase
MSQRTVVLVGPMGSGKSTVGRALARRLGLGHVDTDDIVAQGAGQSIAEIFESEGEAAFRALETAALADALHGAVAVISTGGGVVVSDANRILLRESDALVVWLDGSIDALAGRVGSGQGRPLLDGDVRETLREKIAERGPGYLDVADVRIDTSAMGHEDCVDTIVAVLEEVTA